MPDCWSMMRTSAPWRASSQAIASPVVPAPTIKIGELLAIRADSPKAIVEKYTMLVHRENSKRRLPSAKGISGICSARGEPRLRLPRCRRAHDVARADFQLDHWIPAHVPVFSSAQIEALHS